MARSVTDLHDMISCQICFEEFEDRDPRTLTCLHAFCSVCIQEMLEVTRKNNDSSNNSIYCPVCKKLTVIPDGHVVNLPAFFYYNQIQSALKHLEDNSIVCILCQNNKEVCYYCFQCKIAICLDCRDKHDKIHKNHCQMTVDKNIIRYILCQKHNQHVEAFCVECSKATCCVCLLEDHEKHSVYSFIFESGDIKNDVIHTLNEREESADDFLERLKKIKKIFNNEMESTKKQLKDHHTQMIEDLEEQYESMSLELQQVQDQVNDELNRSRILMENSKECIVDLRKQAFSKIQPIEEVPLARIPNPDELLSEIKKNIPVTDVGATQTKRLTFVKSSEVSLGLIEILDKNYAELKHKFSNINQLAKREYSPTFTINHLPWNLEILKKSNTLGLFLCCNKDSTNEADFELKLLPQKPGVKPFTRKCKHTFTYDEKDWGFSKFIKWSELLNTGYMKNDTIIVACTLMTEQKI